MAVVVLDAAASGRFTSASPYTWTSLVPPVVTSDVYRAYAGFVVPLTSGADLVSAELIVTRQGITSHTFHGMAVPAPTSPSTGNPFSGNPSLGPQVGSMPSGTEIEFNVTSHVRSMLDHGTWSQSARHVGFLTSTSPQARGVTMQLRVTTVDPPSSGDAGLAYMLGGSGAGQTPPVPPHAGAAAVAYVLGGSGVGMQPWGNRGVARLVLGGSGVGDRAGVGGGVGLLGLTVSAVGDRPSTAVGGVGYVLGVSAMSMRPAPPVAPPWREAIASPEYAEAISARDVTLDARVDVLDPSGAVIARLGGPDATHGGIVSGTVTVGEGREVWWDCDLTIDQAELVPTEVGDLLHPLSHNRLRVWWRVLTAPGRWLEVPLGVYYPDWPSVAVSSRDAGVSVAVRGQDVSWLIAQAQLQSSVSVGGLSVDAAIRAVLAEVAPWAPLVLAPTGRRLPAGYEAGEPGANPWQVCRDLATSAAMELRVTREGGIELGAAPSPSAPAVARFVEGVDCLALSASVSVPVGSIANRIRLECNPRTDPDGEEAIEPFVVTVTDDDETSPLWVGHGYFYDRSVSTDTVTTVEAARAMGEGLLRASQALSETGELVVFPHPHLEVGDVLDVDIASVSMTGARQVRGWSLALGSLGGQRVTTTGRRQW